jgi:uncharacterized membrane protein YbaN (DUF454 family)
VKKFFFISLGTISLILGFAGLFLPVLPTTPLVLLAAACYYRSSERLHKWILRSKWFGEIISNYQAGRGITRKTKIKALGLLWFTITISALFYVESSMIRVMMLGIALVVSVYLIRLPTHHDRS